MGHLFVGPPGWGVGGGRPHAWGWTSKLQCVDERGGNKGGEEGFKQNHPWDLVLLGTDTLQ